MDGLIRAKPASVSSSTTLDTGYEVVELVKCLVVVVDKGNQLAVCSLSTLVAELRIIAGVAFSYLQGA